jgi:hypothetical protein
MTQTQRILIYLKSGKEITAIDALNKFGCFRLAARIADLRNQGHTIWTNYITKDNKTFAAYKLSK